MNSSDIPGRTTKAFSVNGDKNTIPVDSSSTTINNGQATMDSGFPPITRIPLSAGGKPPGGKDFNGIFYSISLKQQWQDAGMLYPFNSDFSTAINGYPKGAVIPNSALTGRWLNTIDGNTSTPEVSSSTLTGWVPAGDYGTTLISGLSSSSVTLTTLQAAKDRIVLSGTLTSNINIILPAWFKSWTVVNGCTGNFSVTVKTASGTGVTLPNGLTAILYGDGTNITQDLNLLGFPGRLIGVQRFLSSALYTPTPGTRWGIAEIQGAGGGGGNASAVSGSTIGLGSGGGAGGYSKSLIANVPSSQAVVVGVGGAGGVDGGLSSFGSIIAFGGAAGGNNLNSNWSGTVTLSRGGAAGSASGGNIINANGYHGENAIFTFFGNSVSGAGGGSIFSGGGLPVGGSAGPGNPGNLGSGGSGANASGLTTLQLGGTGGDGFVIIWEFA